jgi:hypothetical protein
MSYVLWIGATVTAFVLGALWYGPVGFMKPWLKENGLSEDFQAGHPARVFGLSFLFSAIAAGGYAHMIGFSDDILMSTAQGAIAGFVFAATSFGINYQFAGRSFKLFLIDGGYHTVQFALYGLVYSAFH